MIGIKGGAAPLRVQGSALAFPLPHRALSRALTRLAFTYPDQTGTINKPEP